jgi:DivIVA domain-containing protein
MTSSTRQISSSGRITGGWVRAAKFPTAKGLSRGYDRKAVDTFLLQCGNGVDWLNGLLIGAENEIDRLSGEGQPSAPVRNTSRVMTTAGSGKRPATQPARRRKPRVSAAARTVRARP